MAALLVVIGIAGCGRSPVEQHIDTSIAHLQAAHDMLKAQAPSIEKLSIAVAQYRSKHRGEFRKLREEGERLLGQLEGEERKRVMDSARKRALGLVQRIEVAAGSYPDKRMAMRLVRPLIVSGTPRGLKAQGQMPWMPKMPKVKDPDQLQGGQKPGAHGPGAGGHAGHNHGLPPSELLKKHGKKPGARGGHAGHEGHDHGPGGHAAPRAATPQGAP